MLSSQRVGLTELAAVDDSDSVGVSGSVEPVELIFNPVDVSCSAATEPPPPLPGKVLRDAATFRLVTTTLPAELDAEAAATSVAAVERSPATAAKEAWN